MKVRELFEREGDYFLPKSLKSAKEDLADWIERWIEDEEHAVSDDWKKKLPAMAKEYLALVKSEIMPAVDYTTHEENVVDMREEEALKVVKKHKLLSKATKTPRDRFQVSERQVRVPSGKRGKVSYKSQRVYRVWDTNHKLKGGGYKKVKDFVVSNPRSWKAAKNKADNLAVKKNGK